MANLIHENCRFIAMRFILLISLCFLVDGQTSAQSQCGSAKKRNALLNSDSVHTVWSKVLEELQILDGDKEFAHANLVTIPVVFHVLWRNADQNISEAQIQSQLEVINEDFRLQNSNFNLTADVFEDLAADVEIEFCLARRDPEGRPTDGIIRKAVSERNIGSGDNYYSSLKGGSDGWDTDRYVNIWVCEIGGGVFGFSTFPLMADPPESEGIVIQPQYLGRTGTAVTSRPQHLGRTLTHELGHYFGLEHLWGPDLGGCSEDDFVDDTPLQERESVDCPNFPLRDICSPRSPGVLFYNYMDYTSDSCMTMFTHGQKMRMWNVLNNFRTDLLQSDGCQTVAVSNIQPAYDAFYPNPFSANIISKNSDFAGLLSVYTAEGHRIHHREYLTQRLSINTDSWSTGTYFFVISKGEEKQVFIGIKQD